MLAAVLLNSRYLPMGVSVAPDLRGSPLRRLLVAQIVVDESWAVARTRDGVDAGRLLGAGLVLYLAWVAGTAAGLLLAGVLPEPQTLGLDAAFPALFLALLVAGVRNRTDTAVALGGAGLALALTPVLPPGPAPADRRAGRPGRGEPMTVWLVVVGVGTATVAIKALGPVALGGRPLPAPVRRVLSALGPGLLAALVATSAFTSGGALVLDARLGGLAAAAIAVACRAPVLVTVIAAAATTAAIRLLAG